MVAITIILALVLGLLVVEPAYSGVCLSLRLSSSTIRQGTTSIGASGFDTCPGGSTVLVILSQVALGESCSTASRVAGTVIAAYSVTANPTYSVTIPTFSLRSGSYCVTVEAGSGAYWTALPLTVTPSGWSGPLWVYTDSGHAGGPRKVRDGYCKHDC